MFKYSENIIDLVTDNPLFALFVIKDGKYIYANQKCADLLELPVDSVIGKRWDLIINYVADPVQREQLLNRYKVRQSTILPENKSNLRLVCPSGKEVWVELVVRNSICENEPVIHGVFIDITRHKKTEEMLTEQNYLRDMLLDSLPHSAMLIRKDRTIIAANRNAREAGARIGGLCWRDYGRGDYISDDDKNYIKKHKSVPKGGIHCTFCMADEALASQQNKNNPEVRAFARIWDTHWVPLDDEIYLHYAIDITERKKNEEALKNSRKRYGELVNLLPQTVFEIDSNGRFTFANKHGLQVSGYTQEDLDKGIDANKLMIPVAKEKVKKNIAKVMAGIETGGTEYIIQKKNGTTFPAIVYSSPIVSNNKSIGLRGVAIDITEIKERENRLQKQKRNLQLLSNRLTTVQENDRIFIARELHDIVGQKLSLAKFNLEKEFIDNPELKNGNFQKISSLISEISDDIRHIISGLHPQTLKNYGLVQTINWYIEECCNNNKTKCDLIIKGEIPRLTDQLELNIYRIFQEATHNILKHAQATVVNILLEFQKEMLILKVSDNGRGFDTDNSTKNSCLHNFGISNMKERTLMIGGTFNIESRIGRGTSVICKVPLD